MTYLVVYELHINYLKRILFVFSYVYLCVCMGAHEIPPVYMRPEAPDSPGTGAIGSSPPY